MPIQLAKFNATLSAAIKAVIKSHTVSDDGTFTVSFDINPDPANKLDLVVNGFFTAEEGKVEETKELLTRLAGAKVTISTDLLVTKVTEETAKEVSPARTARTPVSKADVVFS